MYIFNVISWKIYYSILFYSILQSDLEFKQNQILTLNDEFNVEMFHTRLKGGKAFAAERKIREFKELLLRSVWKNKEVKGLNLMT